MKKLFPAFILSVCVALVAHAKPLRLFVVGNSFSGNTTHYLPDLAKEGGHDLIIAKAQAGGCSLERHWVAAEADIKTLGDKAAKIYGTKSLLEIMGKETWDVITVQQYSMLSADADTYRPFGEKLHAYLHQLQPGAEIVVHQTWAYRTDAAKFGQIGAKKNAPDARTMYEKSRAAYWQLAGDLHARVIPTGDAFWRVNSDPAWAYKADTTFDAKTAVAPALPDQANSLHVGYKWSAEKKLAMDANHANAAGEYLGALVWYGFLFNESPERLKFVPAGVPPALAAHLRQVAWQVVQETAAASAKMAGGRAAVGR